MSKLTLVIRILLGLVFLGSGIAYFFVTPPPPQGAMADFMNGLLATGYFLYLLKGVEILCGLLLISGWLVPLALVVLAPVVLNIFLVHIFMAPEPAALGISVVLGSMLSYLAFLSKEYSPKIKALFKTHNEVFFSF